MKLYSFMFFFLLTTYFSLLFSSITYASASSSSFASRRTMRELSSSTPNHEQERRNEVVDKQWKRPDVQGGDIEASEDEDGLIYHVDYHGVSTHPNPTPKHPRP